jgi:AcrR family transcriptional regulator
MTQATATDTRAAIIAAAFACFRTQSLAKTTIVDIARAAEVSRSTFYEYFRDKETIVEACAEAASQRFYRNMAKAIDRRGGSTLEGRLVEAAVFTTPSPTIDMRDDEAVAEFVRTYVVNGFVDGHGRRR